MSDDTGPLVQQIFRCTPAEVEAFKAEAAACAMPLSHWYVQAARAQAGLKVFAPVKRVPRPAPLPKDEPKARKPAPEAARRKVDAMLTGAQPRPRPAAREIKP